MRATKGPASGSGSRAEGGRSWAEGEDMTEAAATERARCPEGWTLLAWVMGLASVAVTTLGTTVDVTTGAGGVSTVRTSFRLPTPWLFLALAASSLAILFSAGPTRWLILNRRMLGLCFAASMCWQLVFIAWTLVGNWGCYLEAIQPAGGPETRLGLRDPGDDDGDLVRRPPTQTQPESLAHPPQGRCLCHLARSLGHLHGDLARGRGSACRGLALLGD